MSTKLVKRLLRQVSVYHEPSHAEEVQEAAPGKKVKKRSKRESGDSKKNDGPDDDADPLSQQVRMMLRYDNAIARHANSGGRALKKRLRAQRAEGKRRKRAKLVEENGVGTGYSRGSSAARLEHERIFNKKRDAKRKEMESLRSLARMLQKSKKTK